jgi:choline dehydrogenase-like flavoprotein
LINFDIVIIGAGSAGCVLASRLSQNSQVTVGLIEAGKLATDPDIADPLQWPALQGRAFDWAYRTVPQPYTAGRVHAWPRGRVVGGSSCLHAMAHVRGHPDDFAAWAAASGSARWSFEGLLPGFKRSERFSGGASALHGADGPMPVMLPDADLSPVVRAYMAAGLERGAPWLGDHNAGGLAGVSANSLTIEAGRRVSAADAYLVPAMGRPNLTLICGAVVHRLVVDGTRIAGVMAEIGGRTETISAGVTLLCAGAVASPLLLLRSGIGPAAALAAAGVACVADLAGVGENLHDHLLAAGNVYRARQTVPPSRLQHSESLTYLVADAVADAGRVPDVVLGCVAAPTVTECFQAPDYGAAYTILSGVTHPTSRGRIAITGPQASDPPIIDPAYLSTEQDRVLARRALELARWVGHAPALDAWRAEEIYPGAACRDDAAMDAFLQRAVMTHHHPVGTCCMGDVVDADLRLRGFSGCHVVDASVIPAIPSGPIHAAVLAIAETFAADIAPGILS